MEDSIQAVADRDEGQCVHLGAAERLKKNQSTEELKRKANKSALRQRIWTQEEIDYAKRAGSELARSIKLE